MLLLTEDRPQFHTVKGTSACLEPQVFLAGKERRKNDEHDRF